MISRETYIIRLECIIITGVNDAATILTARETEQEHIKEDATTEIKADGKTLAEKLGKQGDGLIEKAIWAVSGAMIIYLLGPAGL